MILSDPQFHPMRVKASLEKIAETNTPLTQSLQDVCARMTLGARDVALIKHRTGKLSRHEEKAITDVLDNLAANGTLQPSRREDIERFLAQARKDRGRHDGRATWAGLCTLFSSTFAGIVLPANLIVPYLTANLPANASGPQMGAVAATGLASVLLGTMVGLVGGNHAGKSVMTKMMDGYGVND